MGLSESARSLLALSVDLRDAVVLLVDDSPRDAEELLVALTEVGLKVLVAESGPAAKQKLMELDDPQVRLQLVHEYLRGKGVVGA